MVNFVDLRWLLLYHRLEIQTMVMWWDLHLIAKPSRSIEMSYSKNYTWGLVGIVEGKTGQSKSFGFWVLIFGGIWVLCFDFQIIFFMLNFALKLRNLSKVVSLVLFCWRHSLKWNYWVIECKTIDSFGGKNHFFLSENFFTNRSVQKFWVLGMGFCILRKSFFSLSCQDLREAYLRFFVSNVRELQLRYEIIINHQSK